MKSIRDVLLNWKLDYVNIERIYESAWAIDSEYILKTGNDITKAKRNIAVISSLHEFGIPVADIVPTGLGNDILIVDDKYYLLTKRIKGEHIENFFDHNYILNAQKCGEIIAKLHIAFRACQANITCWENNLTDEMNGWIKDFFEDNLYTYVSKQEFFSTLAALEKEYLHLPKQLIHRDIHLGNLLFKDGYVSGYIDFDLSQINIRIFDICYFVLGLLIDNFEDEEKIDMWFETLKNVVSGYLNVDTITQAEKHAAVYVMVCIELLFTAYFAKRGSVQLAQNSANMFRWIKNNEEKISHVFKYTKKTC